MKNILGKIIKNILEFLKNHKKRIFYAILIFCIPAIIFYKIYIYTITPKAQETKFENLPVLNSEIGKLIDEAEKETASSSPSLDEKVEIKNNKIERGLEFSSIFGVNNKIVKYNIYISNQVYVEIASKPLFNPEFTTSTLNFRLWCIDSYVENGKKGQFIKGNISADSDELQKIKNECIDKNEGSVNWSNLYDPLTPKEFKNPITTNASKITIYASPDRASKFCTFIFIWIAWMGFVLLVNNSIIKFIIRGKDFFKQ